MNNIIFILLTITFLYLIKCDITILGPQEFSSQFNDNQIEMTFDKIGKSRYDFYTRGELVLDSNNPKMEACQTLSPRIPQIGVGNEFQENYKIFIAKRGGCSFVQKARFVQRAGYSMLLIVNNMETNIKDVIMSDDGSGNDIYIPIAMISLNDGDKIINYLQKKKSNKIFVEINFLKKSEDTKIIDLKIFISSSSLKAYELFNNLSQYINQFEGQINFIPIYVVHRAPVYNPENPIRILNCFSLGRYCYFPKDTTIIKDGQSIMMDDLRQKCLFDITKTSDNNINAYFNYIKNFYTECLNKENLRFNDNCSKNVLKNLGLSIRNIDTCIANSFQVKDLLSNSYIDNENIILKDQYDELLKYKLVTFPAVVINNKPLEGIIKENKIIREICSLIKKKPIFCSSMARFEDNRRKKILVFGLIFLLIIVNIIIFFIFRKYIIERIDERIENGGLDLDSRIKNVIGNYFSLNKINNDYTKMKNNPSSAMELQNQKGKVVDIAVEMT